MPLLRLLHLTLRRRRRRPGGRMRLRMRRPLVLRGRPLVLLRGAHRDGAVGLGHAAVVALAAAVAVVEVARRLLVEAVVGAGPVAGRGPDREKERESKDDQFIQRDKFHVCDYTV